MSLRIRRGSETERTAVRFDQGELVWVQSTTTSRPAYKLYVGDGVTNGGRDIIESSVGSKLQYNAGTGRIDLDLSSGNRINTDDIIQLNGANNRFFTTELAQDAVATMFAAGTMSGIQFVYDDLTNKMNVTVTATGGGGPGDGITAVVDDASPALGGTLDLNNQNINGTGNIDITGDITASGTLSITTGLGSNLVLNGNDVTGFGNVNVTGDITASGVISAYTGLGADLPLNSFDINGAGNITISGYLSVSGLGQNLDLNEYDIIGGGNIDVDGDIGSNNFTAVTAITGSTVNAGQLVMSTNNIQSLNGSLVLNSNTTLECYQDTTGNFINLTGTLTNNPPWVNIYSSNGTLAEPDPVAAGDTLSGFLLFGFDGVSQSRAVTIGGRVDGAVSANIVPGEFIAVVQSAVAEESYILSFNSEGILTVPSIQVGNGTASAPSIGFSTDGSTDTGLFHPGDGILCISTDGVERVRVDNGGMRVAGFMKVANVNGTLPSPAEAGMIVLDGTTFKGYTGSAWVVLG